MPSPINTSGFESQVMPAVNFANPAFFGGLGQSIGTGLQQGAGTIGELQRQKQLAAMAPAEQQLEQAKATEAQRQLLMPVTMQTGEDIVNEPRATKDADGNPIPPDKQQYDQYTLKHVINRQTGQEYSIKTPKASWEQIQEQLALSKMNAARSFNLMALGQVGGRSNAPYVATDPDNPDDKTLYRWKTYIDPDTQKPTQVKLGEASDAEASAFRQKSQGEAAVTNAAANTTKAGAAVTNAEANTTRAGAAVTNAAANTTKAGAAVTNAEANTTRAGAAVTNAEANRSRAETMAKRPAYMPANEWQGRQAAVQAARLHLDLGTYSKLASTEEGGAALQELEAAMAMSKQGMVNKLSPTALATIKAARQQAETDNVTGGMNINIPGMKPSMSPSIPSPTEPVTMPEHEEPQAQATPVQPAAQPNNEAQAALSWAQQNPNDPRAAAILKDPRVAQLLTNSGT